MPDKGCLLLVNELGHVYQPCVPLCIDCFVYRILQGWIFSMWYTLINVWIWYESQRHGWWDTDLARHHVHSWFIACLDDSMLYNIVFRTPPYLATHFCIAIHVNTFVFFFSHIKQHWTSNFAVQQNVLTRMWGKTFGFLGPIQILKITFFNKKNLISYIYVGPKNLKDISHIVVRMIWCLAKFEVHV